MKKQFIIFLTIFFILIYFTQLNAYSQSVIIDPSNDEAKDIVNEINLNDVRRDVAELINLIYNYYKEEYYFGVDLGLAERILLAESTLKNPNIIVSTFMIRYNLLSSKKPYASRILSLIYKLEENMNKTGYELLEDNEKLIKRIKEEMIDYSSQILFKRIAD